MAKTTFKAEATREQTPVLTAETELSRVRVTETFMQNDNKPQLPVDIKLDNADLNEADSVLKPTELDQALSEWAPDAEAAEAEETLEMAAAEAPLEVEAISVDSVPAIEEPLTLAEAAAQLEAAELALTPTEEAPALEAEETSLETEMAIEAAATIAAASPALTTFVSDPYGFSLDDVRAAQATDSEIEEEILDDVELDETAEVTEGTEVAEATEVAPDTTETTEETAEAEEPVAAAPVDAQAAEDAMAMSASVTEALAVVAAEAGSEEAESEKEEDELEADLPEVNPEEVEAELARIDAVMRKIDADQESELEQLLQTMTPDERAALEAEAAREGAQNLEAAAKKDDAEVIEADTSELPVDLDLAELESCIEALLFMSDKPLSLEKLHELLSPEMDVSRFEEALVTLGTRYQSAYHGIELVQVGGGYQLRTKPGRAELARKLSKVQTQKLSGGAMETLALVAYKQPVMKEEVDKVRGVDSSHFIRTLLDRKLIKIAGRSELPGRPMLYGTTSEFLALFGLNSLDQLPSLREVEQMVPSSESARHDEDPRVIEMRKLVGQMKSDESVNLQYNPRDDEAFLKDIRERVQAIPSSTPYLDEQKALEKQKIEDAKLQALGALGEAQLAADRNAQNAQGNLGQAPEAPAN